MAKKKVGYTNYEYDDDNEMIRVYDGDKEIDSIEFHTMIVEYLSEMGYILKEWGEKMKLRKGYYWIKSVTYYQPIGELREDNTPMIGFYDDGDSYPWQFVGSDEIYKTYKKEYKMGHAETRVIPLKRVPDYKDWGENMVKGKIVSGGISMGTALAMIISYSKGNILIWVIIHGLLSWFYVIYSIFV